MELSKHVPCSFDVGDIVLLSNKYITDTGNEWVDLYNNTLGIVTSVDWRWEKLQVMASVSGKSSEGLFNEFILVKKYSNKLVKLIA